MATPYSNNPPKPPSPADLKEKIDSMRVSASRNTRGKTCELRNTVPQESNYSVQEPESVPNSTGTETPFASSGAVLSSQASPSLEDLTSFINAYDLDLSKTVEIHHFGEYAPGRSLPSKGMLSISVPDPKNPSIEFIYNYFVPDERKFIVSEPKDQPYDSTNYDPNDIQYIARSEKTPRFVRLKIEPPAFDDALISDASGNMIPTAGQQELEDFIFGTFSDLPADYEFKDIIERITVEGATSNAIFTGVEIIDTFADKKIYSMLSSSITFQNVSNPIDSPRERAQAFRESLLDQSDVPNPVGVQKQVLIDIMSELQPAGISLAPNDVTEDLAGVATDPITKQSFSVKFNNLFFGDIIDYNTNTLNTIYEDELRALSGFATEAQENLISSIDPTMTYDHDHQFVVEPINLRDITFTSEQVQELINQFTVYRDLFLDPSSTPGALMREALGDNADNMRSQIMYGILNGLIDPTGFLLSKQSIPKVKIIGYVIQKVEQLSNGLTQQFPNYFIDNPKTFTEFIDKEVRYGAVYNYKIRTIALVTSVVKVVNSGDTQTKYMIGDYLVVSDGVNSSVECVENIPPPAPVRVDCFIDYKYRAPVITWEFPLNKQRDIKRFQVFKRKTVDEAFTLVAEYNFDNSYFKTVPNEIALDKNLYELRKPFKKFRDNKFNLDTDEAIYAIASVDAHGLSSGYSSQLHIKYDRYTNKLMKTVVSQRSAPKPYPNMYLIQDFFEDLIRSSGKKRCTVFFDPEYYEIEKKVNGSQSLKSKIDYLKTSDVEFNYTLQLINVDLQQEQRIKFRIADRSGTTVGVPAAKISPTNLSFEFGSDKISPNDLSFDYG